jgi:hypothetical protein
VQSSLNVGFGIDDHQIRGLMRFIKMTSRDSKKRMMYRLEVPQSFNGWPCWTQRSFTFIFILNIEFRKSHTIKGTLEQLVNCATRCSKLQKHILISSQSSQPKFIQFLVVLARAAVPPSSDR